MENSVSLASMSSVSIATREYSGIVGDDRIDDLEVNLVSELHVTAVLVCRDFVLLDRTLIAERRDAFSQRCGVCLQRCPSADLQLIGFVTDRHFIREAEVDIVRTVEADRVKQLLRVECVRIDYAFTGACRQLDIAVMFAVAFRNMYRL